MSGITLAKPVVGLTLLCSLAVATAQAQTSPPVTAPSSTTPSSVAPASPTLPPTAAKDPFGEDVTMPDSIVIAINGQANWDTAFDTLIEKFKQINAWLDANKITPSGPAMTVYTQADDTGFNFMAAIPVAEAPKEKPAGDIVVATAPGGKALKFVHRGSYDTLDTTYEAITNELDRRGLDAKDMFIEEYAASPLTAAESNLVVNIYVPIKVP